jgi:hypothetical protein
MSHHCMIQPFALVSTTEAVLNIYFILRHPVCCYGDSSELTILKFNWG